MGTMPPASPAPPPDPHAGHDMGRAAGVAPTPPQAPPPPEAFSGPRHAADVLYDPSTMTEPRERLRAVQGDIKSYRVMADQHEARIHDGRDGYLRDAQGWYGGDYHTLRAEERWVGKE